MLYILFRQIVFVSFTGALLILAAMLTLQLWGKHARAATRSLVWTLLFLRLCIPAEHLLPTLFTVELPAFAQTETVRELPLETTAVPETMPVQAEVAAEPVWETVVPMVVDADMQTWETPQSKPDMDRDMVETPISLAEIARTLVPVLWLTVAVVLFAGRIWAYNCQVRSLFRTAQLPTQEDFRVWREVCADVLEPGKTCPCRLICSPLAGSPMMCGYFCPTVVLPDMDLDPDALRGILTHELTHYRRRDVWRKLLCLAVRSLHWFNPLVYAASLRWMNDMEMACDDQALEDLDEAKRREYGEMMLDMLRRCHRRQETLTTGFSPRKSAMVARFRNIMDTTQKSRARILPALMAAACLLSGAVTAAAPGQDEGILAAVRYGDDRTDKHVRHKVPGQAVDTNVVYTGKTVDLEDPTGEWEGWFHAELPYIKGEDEWNAQILAEFETRYGDKIAQVEKGEMPYLGGFKIGYETVKWQDTVTIVMKYRNLSRVRYSEDDPGTLKYYGGVSHKIYHYNARTKEFLTTDQFLELYTGGKWTAAKLIEMANEYGFCRDYHGNPRQVQESHFLGVIPSYQGNGQFDAVYSYVWYLDPGAEEHFDNLLVRVLDYEPYMTTGKYDADAAGDKLSALLFRSSTDKRYLAAVYRESAENLREQAEVLANAPKGAIWVDAHHGQKQEIYWLEETLSPHTVDPTLTFAETEAGVELRLSFPGTSDTELVLPCEPQK